MRYLVGLFLILFSMHAWSEDRIRGFRCGNGLVEKGMTMQQVHDLCGQFASYKVWHDRHVDLNHIDVHNNAPIIDIRYDRWTYKPYGGFAVHILFRDGVVVKMVEGERVN